MLIIISIIVVVFIIYLLILTYLLKLNNKKVNISFNTLDLYYKKRWNLLPKIIVGLKDYDELKKVLEELFVLKNTLYNKLTREEKLKLNKKITSNINKINLKNYTSNKDISKLYNDLEKINDNIEIYYKEYNMYVNRTNKLKKIFPLNLKR